MWLVGIFLSKMRACVCSFFWIWITILSTTVLSFYLFIHLFIYYYLYSLVVTCIVSFHYYIIWNTCDCLQHRGGWNPFCFTFIILYGALCYKSLWTSLHMMCSCIFSLFTCISPFVTNILAWVCETQKPMI